MQITVTHTSPTTRYGRITHLHALLQRLAVTQCLTYLGRLHLLTLSFFVLQPVVRKQHNTGFKHKVRLGDTTADCPSSVNQAIELAACACAGKCTELLYDV